MADDKNEIQKERELPWPTGSDPSRTGEFARVEETPQVDMVQTPSGQAVRNNDKNAPQTKSKETHGNRRPLYWFIFGFLVLFLIVVLVGWLMHRGDKKDSENLAKEHREAKPVVETTQVRAAQSQAGLVVPGTTIPLTEAFVYARANGYLKIRLVDLGDKVKKNQLLAVIDAPDLDAQVTQARQQLKQAEQQVEQQKSQLALATVTVQRYRVLVQKGVFSRQDGDQQEANYASQLANVAAAQRNVEAFKANLDRVAALQSYVYVRAPFAGVITQRNVDVGALVSAAGAASGGAGPSPQGQTSSSGGSQQAAQSNSGGSSGSPNTAATSAQSPGQGGPLFAIAQVERLRILVSVPEGYAPAIRVGERAKLAFQEFPGTDFEGDVTRNANSIDQNTRTLLTEVQVDNKAGKLLPGMYTVVTFPPSGQGASPILITGNAVVVRHDQSTVATVVGGKIKMVPVVLGRDFGTAVEILSGLNVGDTIVTDVTDEVTEGAEVKEHEAQAPEEKPTAPPKQDTPPGGSTQYGNPALTDQNLQGQQQNQKGQPDRKKTSSESKQ